MLNDDEDSESFGEDIVDTDVEKGSSDDYDYSDSFINDDDDDDDDDSFSTSDDDDLSVKERLAAKTKGKKRNKRLRKKFQVSDSDEVDSVEILNSDNHHKEDKPSGDIELSPVKQGSDVLPKKKKKKRNKESVVIAIDQGEEKDMPETDKVIESPTDGTLSKKKRKKERREETTGRKKQAIEKSMEKEASTQKLPESEFSSNEVTVEEIGKGKLDGKVAVQGKKVSILYTAKLKETGKVFESNLEEAPLRFRLGGGKVIKGLSNGVEGMRAGGKRRIIIPPSLGYSEEGLSKEDVPKNSWLVYEVEAVKVR